MTWSDAYAQTGAAPSGNEALLSQLISFAPIILMFVIIYFLMIRPQQAKQRQLGDMLKALKKGDKVVTSGGIIGTVWGVDDEKAVLKIGDDTKVEFVKSAIVQVVNPEGKEAKAT